MSLFDLSSTYIFDFIYVCRCMSAYYMCVIYVGGQLGALDSLELELQMAVSHEVGVRNEIRFWKNSQCS